MSNFLEKSCLIDRLFARRARILYGGPGDSEPLLVVLFALFRLGHLALDTSFKGLERACATLGVERLDLPDLAVESPCVMRYGESVYLQKNARRLKQILSHLRRLSSSVPDLFLSPVQPNPSLNPQQAVAVERALSQSLCVLSGGPGTGKTFTAVEIVRACLNNLQETLHVVLSAPTGKAACHLRAHVEKKLGSDPRLQITSGTLHAVLQWSGREEDVIAPLCADLVIVDESSMMDALLFEKFLGALQEGTRLVLIGDPYQLPAVGSGSLFADLVESPGYKGVELSLCLRSDKQDLLRLAETVKKGDVAGALAILQDADTVEWINLSLDSPDAFLEMLWDRFGSCYLHVFSAPVDPQAGVSLLGDFSMLSCLKKGPKGVDAVNSYFLNRVLASAQNASWVALPLVMTGSQSDLDLYNGQQGILVCRPTSSPLSGQFSSEDYVIFEGRPAVPASLLNGFSLAFCLSVHKSQGSEYKEVLVLVPEGSEVFGREILYTALTRAKEKVILAITEPLLRSCLVLSSRRYCGFDSLSASEFQKSGVVR